MITRATFDEFLAQEALAVVGASRKKMKFGYKAFHDLRAKGYKVHPVNPNTGEVDGVKSYPNVAALPKGVGGLVLVIPPSQTERIVREAKAAGITRIWMQPGAESAEAVRFCEENGMTAISGICIMMQAVPVRSIHKIHRFFARLGGKIPK